MRELSAGDRKVVGLMERLTMQALDRALLNAYVTPKMREWASRNHGITDPKEAWDFWDIVHLIGYGPPSPLVGLMEVFERFWLNGWNDR